MTSLVLWIQYMSVVDKRTERLAPTTRVARQKCCPVPVIYCCFIAWCWASWEFSDKQPRFICKFVVWRIDSQFHSCFVVFWRLFCAYLNVFCYNYCDYISFNWTQSPVTASRTTSQIRLVRTLGLKADVSWNIERIEFGTVHMCFSSVCGYRPFITPPPALGN